MGFVFRHINERAQVHGEAPREMAQQVVRPDLVTLVGRERDPVDQVEQRFHAPHQPRLRTIEGPSALATGRGRRRHSLMNARYFGFAGLFCGIALPRSSANS